MKVLAPSQGLQQKANYDGGFVMIPSGSVAYPQAPMGYYPQMGYPQQPQQPIIIKPKQLSLIDRFIKALGDTAGFLAIVFGSFYLAKGLTKGLISKKEFLGEPSRLDKAAQKLNETLNRPRTNLTQEQKIYLSTTFTEELETKRQELNKELDALRSNKTTLLNKFADYLENLNKKLEAFFNPAEVTKPKPEAA